MSETELSRAANFSPPALVRSPPENNLVSTLDWRERHEPPLDPVEALCQCQRRYREVQTESDEEKFALTEAAYFLGLRLEKDPEARLQFIQQPLFQQRKRPLKPHHKLNPILLAVQFLRSAYTEKERKYASKLARALQGAVGANPQWGDIREVLRRYGFDQLASAHARARRKQKGEDIEVLKFTAEATGLIAAALKAGRAGEQIWILAEHVAGKRGDLRLQFVATKPPEHTD
jgi:hypothetical protein